MHKTTPTDKERHTHTYIRRQTCAHTRAHALTPAQTKKTPECTMCRAEGLSPVSASNLESRSWHPPPAAHAQNGPPSALENSAMALPKTKLMMAVSFMTMFSAGPEVSFSGSPTVSPVTEFLCASEPFTNSLPRPSM